MLSNHLNQRVAFQSMFTYKVDLSELDENLVNGITQAQVNANSLVGELVSLLHILMENSDD